MVGRLNFSPLAMIPPAGYPETQEDADMQQIAVRKGTYRVLGSTIEVLRDLASPIYVLRSEDFKIDGEHPVSGTPMSAAMIAALNLWETTMPTYNDLVSKIAAYLVLNHGVATELSDGAAAKLVRDCGLSTILVKGIGVATLGESPRQTFGS